jgi:lipid-A-disaccharide synthase
MTVEAPRFAMVAGEASGDLLAGMLLAGLRARWPALKADGIGGPKMAAQGFEAWWPHDKLAVRGYVEVLSHYREIAGIRQGAGRTAAGNQAGCVHRGRCARFQPRPRGAPEASGVRTIHFVSPSIWAWRGKRIEKIRRATDLVLCIFPFEPEIYAKEGIAAAYVGHPLAAAIPLEVPAQAEPGAPRHRPRGHRRRDPARQSPRRDPVHRAAPARRGRAAASTATGACASSFRWCRACGR